MSKKFIGLRVLETSLKGLQGAPLGVQNNDFLQNYCEIKKVLGTKCVSFPLLHTLCKFHDS